MLTKFILELKYKDYKKELDNLKVVIFLPTEFINLKNLPIEDGVDILLSACEFIHVVDISGELYKIYSWDIISYEFGNVIDVNLKNNAIKLYY